MEGTRAGTGRPSGYCPLHPLSGYGEGRCEELVLNTSERRGSEARPSSCLYPSSQRKQLLTFLKIPPRRHTRHALHTLACFLALATGPLRLPCVGSTSLASPSRLTVSASERQPGEGVRLEVCRPRPGLAAAQPPRLGLLTHRMGDRVPAAWAATVRTDEFLRGHLASTWRVTVVPHLASCPTLSPDGVLPPNPLQNQGWEPRDGGSPGSHSHRD